MHQMAGLVSDASIGQDKQAAACAGFVGGCCDAKTTGNL